MKKRYIVSTFLMAGLIMALGSPFLAFGAETLLASYETGQDNSEDMASDNWYVGVGQSFKTPNDETSYNLTSAHPYIKKTSTPTGTFNAYLYSEKHATAYGTDSLPDQLLATSDAVNVSSVDTNYSYIPFAFSGAEQYEMSPNTAYVIVVKYINTNQATGKISWGADFSAPSYAGNNSGAQPDWTVYNTIDSLFKVYGEEAGAPAPTVSAIDPVSGYDNGALSGIEITGTNFVATPTVKLTKAGESDITCSGTTWASPTSLTGISCDITGVALGDWIVKVINPDAQFGTLIDGFEVLEYIPTGNNYTSQTNKSVEGTTFFNGVIQNLNSTTTASTFIADDIYSVKVRLKVHKTNANQYLELGIRQCEAPNTNGNCSILRSVFYVSMASTSIQNDIWTDYIFATSTPITQTTNQKDYLIEIQSNYGGVAVAGASTNIYPNGALYQYGGSATSSPDPIDLYFVFNPIIPNDTISITYPSNNSTDIQPFSDYRGQYTNSSSRANYYDYDFRVSTGTQPFLSNDAYNLDFSMLDWTASSTRDWQFRQGVYDTLNSGGTYYAQIRMKVHNSETITATSSIIKFTMADTLNSYQEDTSVSGELLGAVNTASTTSYGLNDSCEAQSGFLSYSSCILFSFLFTPHESTLNNWSLLKSELSLKPPFGYFTVYQAIISGLTTATTSSAVELADISALSVPLLNPLKAIFTMIIWFLFSWSTFTRLKYIQL